MNQSHLLRALEQLNDSAWQESLLPRLIEDKSAANFALTCKQLRQLCQQGQLCLRLAAKDSTSQDMCHLPQHFPGCEYVIYTSEDTEGTVALSAVLPALARLPKLQQLDVVATKRHASDPSTMSLALDLARLQLTGLKDLHLFLGDSWAGSSYVWQVLGRATQLTSLGVWFNDSTPSTVKMAHVSGLQPLGSTLQSLTVLSGHLEPSQACSYSFLSSLTSLTCLSLTLGSVHGLSSSIPALTNLQSMWLSAALQADNAKPEIGEAECAALAQLTRLTELRMAFVKGAGSSPPFLSALQSLKQLQVLGATEWSADALPVLAGLSKLSDLGGLWQDSQQQQQHCPAGAAAAAAQLAANSSSSAAGNSTSSGSVQLKGLRMLGGGGQIPWEVLGAGLEATCQWKPWAPAIFSSMIQHCPQLGDISMDGDTGTCSMPPDAPVAQRTAAIASLSRLRHLTRLRFAASEDAELAALAGLVQLKDLHVLAADGYSCTPMGLMHLARLPGLQQIQLELPGMVLHRDQAKMNIIASLKHIPVVGLAVQEGCVAAWKAAVEEAAAAGLKTPARLTIQGAWPELYDDPAFDML